MLSIKSKNKIPSIKPTAAGSQAILPCSLDISIAGIRSDHTLAAIITPAAKPSRVFSIFALILSFIKNTIAAPRVVPSNGINKTTISSIFYPSPSLITPIVITQLFDVIVYFHNIIRTPNTRSPYPNLFYNFCFSSFFNPAYYLSTNLFD